MRWLTLSVLLVGCTSEGSQKDEEDPLESVGPKGFTGLGLPLAEPDMFYQVTGMDHDPDEYDGSLTGMVNCTNYDGRSFPWCYDGHSGTDFLMEGGFETMDNGSVEVVAAADGVVVDVHDGEYDRCYASIDAGEVTCDGHDMVPNTVTIDHGRGLVTRSIHLKKGSLMVEIGDEVACGDPIALVGSSGWSSTPHLHIGVYVHDELIDPYAGTYSQRKSLWEDQGHPEGLPVTGCTTR